MNPGYNMNILTLPNSASHYFKWQLALDLLENLGKLRGSNSAVAVAKRLLSENGLKAQQRIDYAIVDALSDYLQGGGKAPVTHVGFLPPSVLDAETGDQLKQFVVACRALLVTDFGEILRMGLKSCRLTKKCAASQACVPFAKLNNWTRRRSKFPTDMAPEQALRLESVLSGNGEIIAAYVALSQYSAFAVKPNLVETALGTTSFRQRLRRCWRGTKYTKEGLLNEVKQQTNISISPSLFSHWCAGLGVPSLEKEPAIVCLDNLCSFGGQLIADWRKANPRQIYTEYRSARKCWPASAKAELHILFCAKPGENEAMDMEKMADGESFDDESEDALNENCRWRRATRELFAEFVEQFFGYLLVRSSDGNVVQPRQHGTSVQPLRTMEFEKESLSVTLLCDWDLVEKLFKFVQTRTGRTVYTMSELNRTKTLLSLYTRYMIRFAEDATRHPYWIARHAEQVESGAEKEFLNLVEKEVKRKWWQKQLELASAGAWSFLRNGAFERVQTRQGVQALLDRNVAMWSLAAEIEARVMALPLQVLCLKTAKEMRRLAIAALLWARCFRPGTLLRLDLDKILLLDDERVQILLEEEDFKNNGKGGSAGGLKGKLPNIHWFFIALRRWKKEGRRFIMNQIQARGGKDDNSFFLSLPYPNGGKAISASTIHDDVLAVHGYPPYGHRRLFGSAAYISGAPIDNISLTLKNTPAVALAFYATATEAQKTARASKAVAGLLACGG